MSFADEDFVITVGGKTSAVVSFWRKAGLWKDVQLGPMAHGASTGMGTYPTEAAADSSTLRCTGQGATNTVESAAGPCEVGAKSEVSVTPKGSSTAAEQDGDENREDLNEKVCKEGTQEVESRPAGKKARLLDPCDGSPGDTFASGGNTPGNLESISNGAIALTAGRLWDTTFYIGEGMCDKATQTDGGAEVLKKAAATGTDCGDFGFCCCCTVLAQASLEAEENVGKNDKEGVQAAATENGVAVPFQTNKDNAPRSGEPVPLGVRAAVTEKGLQNDKNVVRTAVTEEPSIEMPQVQTFDKAAPGPQMQIQEVIMNIPEIIPQEIQRSRGSADVDPAPQNLDKDRNCVQAAVTENDFAVRTNKDNAPRYGKPVPLSVRAAVTEKGLQNDRNVVRTAVTEESKIEVPQIQTFEKAAPDADPASHVGTHVEAPQVQTFEKDVPNEANTKVPAIIPQKIQGSVPVSATKNVEQDDAQAAVTENAEQEVAAAAPKDMIQALQGHPKKTRPPQEAAHGKGKGTKEDDGPIVLDTPYDLLARVYGKYGPLLADIPEDPSSSSDEDVEVAPNRLENEPPWLDEFRKSLATMPPQQAAWAVQQAMDLATSCADRPTSARTVMSC